MGRFCGFLNFTVGGFSCETDVHTETADPKTANLHPAISVVASKLGGISPGWPVLTLCPRSRPSGLGHADVTCDLAGATGRIRVMRQYRDVSSRPLGRLISS
jgi:hypothetical protein